MLSTDFVVIATDASGNMLSPPRFAVGLEACRIGVETRLRLFRGEWFVNLDAGIAWIERPGVDPGLVLIGNTFDEVRVRRALIAEILDCPGVVEVLELLVEFDAETRTVSVSFRARAEFDDTSGEFSSTVGIGG